ncbi:MAG: DUF6048 family protein [Prevotella sp.]|uniref:DUF6048 family protein n=1 Tax=Prevotella sp. TaxID=59823 RepID=UPI002A311BC5|nr:DUF6048 family protein [Prevotella sp.]MDD7318739.1 DUF6048 family protein [Prevotellaceae bacterium]MDY4019305.1 DUF6048 family protein [Prevotella sp.]
MTPLKSIYAYISGLAISLLLLPITADAQRRKTVEVPDTLPFYRGVAVSADLVGAGMAVFGDYGQYEGAVRLNLRNRYFPVVEVGLGKADHTDDVTKIRYKTSAPYGKIGIDFNLLKNKNDIYRLYGGVRYAYASWEYDLEHPPLTDPVWGGNTEYGGSGIKCHYHWAEAVFGVDATIWGPIHLGWSVRYCQRISYDNGTLGNSWYVPGYGKDGGSRLGGTFNIIFEI